MEGNDGIIGSYNENGKPVIVKFVAEKPNRNVQNKLPYLLVISWKYNGDENNGMPLNEDNERMILLEQLLQEIVLEGNSYHAYSRTGNSLKELNYYVTNQNEYMDRVNILLKDYEDFPISFDFYADNDWDELATLFKDFKVNSK